MELSELIKSRANVSISISACELADFAEDLIDRTRRSLENDIAESRSEVFYSKDQVCRILSINPSTLWNWDKRNYLKPIKVGGLNRYRKSDIDGILGRKGGK